MGIAVIAFIIYTDTTKPHQQFLNLSPQDLKLQEAKLSGSVFLLITRSRNMGCN